MNKNEEGLSVRDAGMHRERIELKDGRYLIYYTFDASLSPDASSDVPAEQENPATAEKHV